MPKSLYSHIIKVVEDLSGSLLDLSHEGPSDEDIDDIKEGFAKIADIWETGLTKLGRKTGYKIVAFAAPICIIRMVNKSRTFVDLTEDQSNRGVHEGHWFSTTCYRQVLLAKAALNQRWK
jgi:hypothetical protein